MKTIIVSLGEFVVPTLYETLVGFSVLLRASVGEIQTFLPSVGSQIEDFKLGRMDEQAFKQEMCDVLRTKFNQPISLEAFNTAWNSQNPSFEKFSPHLGQVLSAHQPPEQSIVFVSHTNPIDMRHLISELAKGGIPFTTDELGNLSTIQTIPVHLSYVEKKNKKAMVTDLLCQESPATLLTTSLGSSGILSPQPPQEFLLVIGENKVPDEYLARALEAERAALKPLIMVRPWKKNISTFADAIAPENRVSISSSLAS